MENLIKSYEEQKSKIKSRLNSFKNLPKKEQYKEFLFCLLTPQSSAQRCWQAVKELSKLTELNQQDVLNILKSKTRFYITKSARILSAKENFEKIKPLLNNPDKKEAKKKNKKHYLEIENIFLNFANSISMPPGHLDLLWWNQQTGEIFK